MGTLIENVRAYVAANRAAHQAELAQWVALPSVSTTGEGIEVAARHAMELLRRSGLEASIVDTGGWPLVVGRTRADDTRGHDTRGDDTRGHDTRGRGDSGGPHVVVYGHYDVQPPGPLDEWDSPPFEPTVRAGRMYGRGTGDNKGQHLAQLLALRALRDVGAGFAGTVTVLLDGEEEIGSPNLPATLGRLRETLNADRPMDLAIWSDGPVHTNGEPSVVLGVRGIVCFEIVVRGAAAPLHSGNWGGVAPNPAWELIWLLSTMRAPDGRILIEGHDAGAQPLDPAELAALRALPVDVPGTLADAGIDRMDAPRDRPFNDRLALPTFNINTLSCVDAGEHRTVIPSVAIAGCDMRLVGGQRSETVIAALRAHIASHLPHAELRLVRGVMEASRTRPETPYTDTIVGAVAAAYGRPPVLVPSLGGSLPIAALSDDLGLPCYGLPLANVDERNHAPNENLELERFHNGITAAASVLAALAGQDGGT